MSGQAGEREAFDVLAERVIDIAHDTMFDPEKRLELIVEQVRLAQVGAQEEKP